MPRSTALRVLSVAALVSLASSAPAARQTGHGFNRPTTADGSSSSRSACRCRPTASGWSTASRGAAVRTSCACSRATAARPRRCPSASSRCSPTTRGGWRTAIGMSEEQEAKLRKDKKPVHKRLGILELASGRETIVDGVESFAVSPSGTHVAMRRYAPESGASRRTERHRSAAPTKRSEPGHDADRARARDRHATRRSDRSPRSRGRTRAARSPSR